MVPAVRAGTLTSTSGPYWLVLVVIDRRGVSVGSTLFDLGDLQGLPHGS